MQLTLVNVANPLRSAMASDELVCRVVASPQLLRWIVSGSHMDEQYWLNTCEVSAYNNAFTARMITVAHCMVITRTISADLRRNVVANLSVSDPWTGSLWRCDMRSIRAHCEATLDAADRQLETLTRRAHRALDQGSDMRELHAILMEWHRVWSLTRVFACTHILTGNVSADTVSVEHLLPGRAGCADSQTVERELAAFRQDH